MKNRFLTIFIFIAFFLGVISSLNQLYGIGDEIPHSKLASYYYLVFAILIFLLLNLQKNISTQLKGVNSAIIFLFTLGGIILALICFYALDDDELVDIFSASLFFLSSMIPASYIFVLFKKRN